MRLLQTEINSRKIPTSIYGNKYPENYKEASGSISPETVVEKIKSVI